MSDKKRYTTQNTFIVTGELIGDPEQKESNNGGKPYYTCAIVHRTGREGNSDMFVNISTSSPAAGKLTKGCIIMAVIGTPEFVLNKKNAINCYGFASEFRPLTWKPVEKRNDDDASAPPPAKKKVAPAAKQPAFNFDDEV